MVPVSNRWQGLLILEGIMNIRTAVIPRNSIGGPTREVVLDYLPSNYAILCETSDAVIITGSDVAGFTLDAVIARLGSGLIACREIVPDPEPEPEPELVPERDPEVWAYL